MSDRAVTVLFVVCCMCVTESCVSGLECWASTHFDKWWLLFCRHCLHLDGRAARYTFHLLSCNTQVMNFVETAEGEEGR